MDVPLHPFSGPISCVNETHKCRIHVNAIKKSKAELNSSQANQVYAALLCGGYRKENIDGRLFREDSPRKFITISVFSGEVTDTKRIEITQSQHLFLKQNRQIFFSISINSIYVL